MELTRSECFQNLDNGSYPNFYLNLIQNKGTMALNRQLGLPLRAL